MSQARSQGAENRQARTMALQVLFELDLTDHALDDVLRRYSDDLSLPQPVRRYLESIVDGVMDSDGRIDAEIAEAAPQFPVDQLPAVDRNILRMALHELQHETDVPYRAIINEAVELAKQFGGDNSSRFVNGVLGTLAAKHRPEARRGGDSPQRAS